MLITAYLRLRALGTPAATLWLVTNGIFRGLGELARPCSNESDRAHIISYPGMFMVHRRYKNSFEVFYYVHCS